MKGLILLDRDGTLNEMVIDPEHGTIDSPLHPDQVSIIPGVPETLGRLTRAGYTLAIVSNQPAWSKGKTTKKNLERVHKKVVDALESQGGCIAGSYICFHKAEDQCACRKPKTGLLEEAIGRHLKAPVTQDSPLKKGRAHTTSSNMRLTKSSLAVVPAKAGTQGSCRNWIPACAGMTKIGQNFNSFNIWMVGDGLIDVQAGQALGLKTAFLAKRKAEAVQILSEHHLKPTLWCENLRDFSQIILRGGHNHGRSQ